MSLKEKQLWASLLVGLVVWIAYAVWAGPILFDPAYPQAARTTGLGFLAALGVFVLAEGVLAGVMAWLQRRDRPARDQDVVETGLIAGQAAFVVLAVFVGLIAAAIGVFAVWMDGLFGLGLDGEFSPRGPAILAHALLYALLIAEGVRAVLTLLLIRRRR